MIAQRNAISGMAGLAVLLLAVACVPGVAEEERRASEDRASSDPANGQAGDGADVPVPVFLVDAATIKEMVEGVDTLAPTKAGTEQAPSGPTASNEATEAINATTTRQKTMFENFNELVAALQRIVVDQFGGQVINVPGGHHVFRIREDIAASSIMNPLLAEVQVIAPAPADRYRVTIHCGAGLPAGQVRVCARIDFQPSAADRNKGVVDIVGWTYDSQSKQARYAFGVDHATEILVGGMFTESTDFELGLEYRMNAGVDAHILKVVVLQTAKPVSLNLEIFNNLAVTRSSIFARQIGDLAAYETAMLKDVNRPERVQQAAFLPSEIYATFEGGVLPRSIFTEYSPFNWAMKALEANIRTPTIDLDCSQFGQLLADEYPVGQVPAEVAAVPANVCLSASVPDFVVIHAGLTKFCADGKVAEARVKISKKPGPFSTIDVKVCDVKPWEQRNPQFYDGLITVVQGTPPAHLEALRALMDEAPVFMETGETLGRIQRYDLDASVRTFAEVESLP